MTSSAFGVALAVKADAASLNDYVTTSSLNTSLAGKQNLFTDGSLLVARTSGLQNTLDSLTSGLAGKENTLVSHCLRTMY